MFNISDSDNISSDKKKLRRNKKVFYENERNNIINDLINFINNSKDGDYIYLIDLYNNENLNIYINNNIDNIKNYRCSSWGYFISENNNKQGDVITLLKSILKDHGFQIYRKDITAEKNNIKKRYTTIHLIQN